jgi:hypothetical protein
MAETIGCPVCQGSGMTGASSCARCRGTGSVKMPDANLLPQPAAAEADAEVSAEVRKIVEDELDEAMHTPRLKLKGRQVRLSAGSRRGRGIGFKN